MYISESEKKRLFAIKACYDDTGSVSGTAQRLGLQDWKVKKALRKGHWLGLFEFNKYSKKAKVVKKEPKIKKALPKPPKARIKPEKRLTQSLFNKIIRCVKRKYTFTNICKMLKLHNYELKKLLKKAKKRGWIKADTWTLLKLEYNFDEAVFKQIRKYTGQLYNVPEISKLMHITSNEVRQTLKMAKAKGLIKSDKTNPLKTARFDREIFNKIVQYLKEDYTVLEICSKLKIHIKYLKAILLKAKQKKIIRSGHIKSLRQEVLTYAAEKRILRTQSLYHQLGSLENVAKKMRVTRERVRQILRRGEKQHLFEYKLAKHMRVQNLTRKVSIDDMKRASAIYSAQKIREIYDLSESQYYDLLKIYNLDKLSIKNSASNDNDLIIYNDIVRELGHHPTTTEMIKKNDWRNLWHRLYYRYGSMDNFRKQYGIPIPPKGYSRFKEVAIPKRMEEYEKKKKENREFIINLLRESKRPLCQTEIVKMGSLCYVTTSKYLLQLIKDGLISVKREHPKLLYELNRAMI